MDDTLATRLTDEESARAQETIQQQLTEIECLRALMRRDQEEILASRDRTDAILIRIQAQLTRLRTT